MIVYYKNLGVTDFYVSESMKKQIQGAYDNIDMNKEKNK